MDSGKQFQVTYGSGAVAGNIISDNVNIAGLALDKQYEIPASIVHVN